jgi:hypothetical protein
MHGQPNLKINYEIHETKSLSCNMSYTQLGGGGIRATN